MKAQLPAIKDLYKGELSDIQQQNEFNVLMNQPPAESWVKQHPFIKNHNYIPIERIEYLLTRVFILWKVEIISYKLIANSMATHIRLHYLHPVTNQWEYQDGIGASALQTNKDANPTDITQIKTSAVMMSAPASETFAIKDAAEKLGKLFGKDINRKDESDYNNLLKSFGDSGLIKIGTFGYIENLIRTSLFDEDIKMALEQQAKTLTENDVNDFIRNLQDNQKEPENPNQKHIQEKLDIIEKQQNK